jgi:hypothetical protein
MSDAYDRLADKVGLVPNVRERDNLYQGIAILCVTALTTPIGLFVGGWPLGVIESVVAGLVVGGLGSGFVLMIVGLMRRD